MSEAFVPGPIPAARSVEEMTRTLLMRRCELLEKELETEKRSAETDRLTRLGNSLALERRTHARDGWFVYCDLDGFKKAQDEHPAKHTYGDLILVEFADFLRSVTRQSSDRVAARKGGDEFVVWVPTWEAATRLKLTIRCWLSEDGKVSASVGMGKDIAAADAAMYLDKRSKKRRALAEALGVAHIGDALGMVLKSLGVEGR